MSFEFGCEELPPALEDALAGKEVGYEVEVSFEPGEAFGEYNPDGVVALAKSDFPEDVEMAIGEWICVTVEDEEKGSNEELEMRILEIHTDSVILDANHPLADKALDFWVRVESVREALFTKPGAKSAPAAPAVACKVTAGFVVLGAQRVNQARTSGSR